MTKDEQIAALRAALTWVLDNEAVYAKAYGDKSSPLYRPAGFDDAGCGCCSGGRLDVPPEIWATVKEVIS